MKKIIPAFLFLLVGTSAIGQWSAVSHLVSGTDTASNVNKIKNYGSVVYACSNKGLFSSTDDGSSWTNLTYSKANTMAKAIRSVHVNTINGDLYVATDSAVFKSTDNGSTWSAPVLNTVSPVNDIDHSGGSIVISIGTFPNGTILYTTDNFATVPVVSNAANHAYFDFLADGSDLFVAGNEGVYRSTDSGATWAISGTGFTPGSNLRSLTKSEGVIFAGHIGGGGLYNSMDNGATWNLTDTATFHGFCQVFDLTSANGTVVATMDGACNTANPIKASTDSGLSWPVYMNGLTTGFYPVLGRNTSGSCFFTFKNNDKLFYRICNSNAIESALHSMKKPTLSPNPVSDKISIDLNRHYKSVSISIVNTSGQVVDHWMTSDIDKLQLDVSDFASGIYFVQIRTDAGSYAVKFVKE